MRTKLGEVYIQCAGAVAGTFDSPTWHVQVIYEAENMVEAQTLGGLFQTRTLNMQQAKAAGVPLPVALTALNTETMALAERQAASIVEKDAELTELRTQLAVALRAVAAASSLRASLQ